MYIYRYIYTVCAIIGGQFSFSVQIMQQLNPSNACMVFCTFLAGGLTDASIIPIKKSASQHAGLLVFLLSKKRTAFATLQFLGFGRHEVGSIFL